MSDASSPVQLSAREVLRSASVRRLLGSSLAFYIGVMLQGAILLFALGGEAFRRYRVRVVRTQTVTAQGAATGGAQGTAQGAAQ